MGTSLVDVQEMQVSNSVVRYLRCESFVICWRTAKGCRGQLIGTLQNKPCGIEIYVLQSTCGVRKTCKTGTTVFVRTHVQGCLRFDSKMFYAPFGDDERGAFYLHPFSEM